ARRSCRSTTRTCRCRSACPTRPRSPSMTWTSRPSSPRRWLTTSPTCGPGWLPRTGPRMRPDEAGGPQLAPVGRPFLSRVAQGRGEYRMRAPVAGEYLAQVRNPDPFAVPAWRSPVYRTSAWIIIVVQLARLAWRLARFLARHPVADTIVAVLVLAWLYVGWPAVAGLVIGPAVVVGVGRGRWPASFPRRVAAPAHTRWRIWYYRRRWTAVMMIGRLAVTYQGRVLLPALGTVTSTGYTDRIAVALVSGQSAADVSARADNLAHGFGAILCRVRSHRPGAVLLEFVRRDALAAIIPALPIPAYAAPRALPVRR